MLLCALKGIFLCGESCSTGARGIESIERARRKHVMVAELPTCLRLLDGKIFFWGRFLLSLSMRFDCFSPNLMQTVLYMSRMRVSCLVWICFVGAIALSTVPALKPRDSVSDVAQNHCHDVAENH